MKTKYCPECGQVNMATAKFCMACKFEFPKIEVASLSRSPSQKHLSWVDDSMETDSDINSGEGDSAKGVCETIMSTFNLQKKEQGIKLKDAVGTAISSGGKRNKKNERNKGKQKNPSAKEILKSVSNQREVVR